MTTIGRLQQALAAVTNDVTVAAANFNFDFALVKCEPPQEYHPLGTILSAKRKHDAELGPIHITARRLGALFEGVCPNTPKLVQAYGIRTSEIARLANDKISSIYAESIFAAHTGIDATTIWAAATSSKAALPVHLLACMLARQWSPEEAISIWVELIKERREVIARKLEAGDLMSFALATAATQQEIPRQQLAEWDASARAWLQTADSVKEYQQIQLLQILKNISLPVNSNPQLYTSVVDAWVSALDTIEKLICGMPQAVNTGACFLALASWHLYPDITAFGARNVEVEMKDPLFASGGVLSLGLIPSPADSRGVYWSLPLAYLRHYGAPIHKERTLSADFSRITCSQMLQVVLGCLLGTWEVPRESNKEAAQFIASLNQLLQESADLRDKVWLRLTLSTLASFASIFLNATGEEAETNAKLVFHGRKRAHLFFGDLKNSEHASSAMVGTSKDVERPCFGLLDLHKLLSCLKDTESRLQLLRNLAKRVPNVRGQDIILRYVLDEQDIKGRTGHPQRFKLGSSRLSRETPQRKRCHDAYLSDEKLFPILRTDETREKDYIGYATFSKSCFICLSPINAHYCYEGQINRPREGHVEYPANLTRGGAGFWADPHPGSAVCPRAFFKENGAILEVCIGAPPDSATEVRQFELVMGDQNSMSIMVATGESVQKWHATSPQPNISDLLWCLENNLFSKQKLAEQVASSQKTMDRVRTVAAVSKIYDPLPDTTLSINVFERPLLQAKWAQDQRHNGDYVREGERWFTSSSWFHTWMDRGRTFAVITYFQSGGLDVAPDQLKDVIALSSGDSLFIAKAVSIL
ncbi:MAG: hypothetical protein M1822_002625 [Bathelium mastoideum]|nr:MAG: hypothetical protein M1822_002625 [Bathelium mastoideum]